MSAIFLPLRKLRSLLFVATSSLVAVAPHVSSAGERRDWRQGPVVPNSVAPAVRPVAYSALTVGPRSYLGERLAINLHTGLLQTFDLNDYLRSYGKKPRWPTGEYLGKFMHGLSAMYLHTGEPAAKARLDAIVAEWHKVQAPDGWLGTAERFKSWDIWEHKYVLLGLLEYHALTGDDGALEAARKIGDLFLATIGPGLGDINYSGHWAMGSASILEPMVHLYRFTGDTRFKEFCDYIVESFESPTGPKLISVLTTGSRRVTDVEDTFANRAAREVKFPQGFGQVRNRSKGYEMLSCIIGLVRMYELTAEERYLAVARNAWTDIKANRLYLTGSSGADECFKDDHCLPAEHLDSPAEACVTAHWMFLSRLLFELTGELQYVEAVENSFFNHLLASQRPQDGHQSYNTGMNGRKVFGRHDAWGTDGKPPCCISSVMREIPRTLEALWTKFPDHGLAALIYHAGGVKDTVRTLEGDEVALEVEVETDYPVSGRVRLTVTPSEPGAFQLALRVPAWTREFTATVGGETVRGRPGEFLRLVRRWQPGEVVAVEMDLNERLVPGGASYPGHYAVMRGPQVLSLSVPEGAAERLEAARLSSTSELPLRDQTDLLPQDWIGRQAYRSDALRAIPEGFLVPFADVGQPGLDREFLTWIPSEARPDRPAPAAPAALAAEALDARHIRIRWEGSAGDVAGYRLERFREDVGLWFHVKSTAGGETICTDGPVNVVTPGATYRYRVAAYNDHGVSAYSGETRVTTPGVTPPAAPTGLRITGVAPAQIQLAWDDRSDNEDGFSLECRIGASDKWLLIAGRAQPDIPAFTDYGLQPGETYTYRVRSYNTAGHSDWSAEVSTRTPAFVAQGR